MSHKHQWKTVPVDGAGNTDFICANCRLLKKAKGFKPKRHGVRPLGRMASK